MFNVVPIHYIMLTLASNHETKVVWFFVKMPFLSIKDYVAHTSFMPAEQQTQRVPTIVNNTVGNSKKEWP